VRSSTKLSDCIVAQVEFRVYFVGTLVDQLVREQQCDDQGFCLRVRLVVDKVAVGDYPVANTAGVTLNGFVHASLSSGVHEVRW
jgi:hypothetical protein